MERMLHNVTARVIQIIILVFIILLAGCNQQEIETNMSETMEDFKATTQDGEPLTSNDLAGEWWIANFMYTNCTMVCPTMTPNLISVQNDLDSSNLDAQIISFSIDPEYDSPDVLKDYAEEYQIDLSNWNFLTGYDFESIQDLSENSFKTVLEDGGPEGHEFVHSTYVFLINPEGEVVKQYDGISENELQTLVDDLETVLD